MAAFIWAGLTSMCCEISPLERLAFTHRSLAEDPNRWCLVCEYFSIRNLLKSWACLYLLVSPNEIKAVPHIPQQQNCSVGPSRTSSCPTEPVSAAWSFDASSSAPSKTTSLFSCVAKWCSAQQTCEIDSCVHTRWLFESISLYCRITRPWRKTEWASAGLLAI